VNANLICVSLWHTKGFTQSLPMNTKYSSLVFGTQIAEERRNDIPIKLQLMWSTQHNTAVYYRGMFVTLLCLLNFIIQNFHDTQRS
jgi:hypothetical protein